MSDQRLKLLLVEDEPHDAELLTRHLRLAGIQFDVTRVDNESDYVEHLNRHGRSLDAILSDYSLPSFDGLRGLQIVRERGLDVPFILVSGTIGENLAVEAMHLGATDYVLKGDLTRLPTALRRGLERRRLHADNRRLEEQLRQSQKMEAVGQLAAGVAHDFNNLLTIIRANASQLLETEPSPRELETLSQEILSAADRAAALTRQLLLFTRKQAARLAIVNLNAVVNELAKLLHRVIGEDISLSLSLAPELPETLADAAMIEQVLINLATNARDAIVSRRAGSRDERGSISISTRVEVVGAGRPELPAGPYVCIEVKDDGDGISPAVLPQVFEPFFTTKDVGKGTGLGLATVYGIVKQHRGDITVETAAGEGTTFCVLLPAQSVADSSRTRGSAPIQASLPGTGTILVVEDEAAVQAAVNRVLRRQGFNVLLASSGPEALAVWEAHKNEVDVLLTDLVMPLGMRGHELARKIHAEKPSLRVILMTGYSADVASGALPLPDGYRLLEKPFAADELLRTVVDALTPPTRQTSAE